MQKGIQKGKVGEGFFMGSDCMGIGGMGGLDEGGVGVGEDV